MNYRLIVRIVVLLMVALAFTATISMTSAQQLPPRLNPGGNPIDFAVALTGGAFTPQRSDLYRVRPVSGGPANQDSVNVAYLNQRDCVGFTRSNPNFRLTYTVGGNRRLNIYYMPALGDVNVSLIVRYQDGTYYCNPDSFPDVWNPTVLIANARGGVYDIWVATQGAYMPGGELYISENPLCNAAFLCVNDRLNYYLPGRYSGTSPVALPSGFTPDPHTRANIRSGGDGANSVDVNSHLQANNCVGFATREPDYVINYTAGTLQFLRFYFIGDGGTTTLIINKPGQGWRCSDNVARGVADPQIDFNSPNPPASGLYRIWVATAPGGTGVTGTLYITQLSGCNTTNPCDGDGDGGGCGCDEEAEEPTPTPTGTDEGDGPTITPTPSETDELAIITETPAATETDEFGIVTETPFATPTDEGDNPTMTPSATETGEVIVPTGTPMPTQTAVPPVLSAVGTCSELDGVLIFAVSNNGGVFNETVTYTVMGPNGIVQEGTLGPLAGTESVTLVVGSVAPGTYTFIAPYNNGQLTLTALAVCTESLENPTVVATQIQGLGD